MPPQPLATDRRRFRCAGALLTLVLVTAAPRSADAQVGLLDAFRDAPLPSASAGIIYRYDPTTATFVRESEVAGQIYMERPATIGAGAWNLNFTYQWVDLHFDNDFLRARAQVHEFFGGLTYGVTDDLDLGLTVPLLYFTIDVPGEAFDSSTLTVDPVFLRAKYRLVDRPEVQLSTGLIVQMLTQSLTDGGDQRVQPGFYLYASRERIPVGAGMFLKPYVNVGVDWFEDDVDHPEVKWAVGLDWNVTSHVTPAVAFLATHFPNEPDTSSFDDSYGVSVGVRVSLWRDTLVGFANVLFPIDNLGDFRLGPFSEVNAIPLIGIEATL